MLWMGKWVHLYTFDNCAGVGEFLENWGAMEGPLCNYIVMSWLRVQTRIDCIPPPNHMYKKCLSTLICYGWAHECILILLHMCRWGWIFGKMGYLSPSDVCFMSWLRVWTPIYYIPLPYHMYEKCFSTLICCGWANECTLILLTTVQVWANFWKSGVLWRGPSAIIL